MDWYTPLLHEQSSEKSVFVSCALFVGCVRDPYCLSVDFVHVHVCDGIRAVVGVCVLHERESLRLSGFVVERHAYSFNESERDERRPECVFAGGRSESAHV